MAYHRWDNQVQVWEELYNGNAKNYEHSHALFTS